jgi:hypothetical protein
MIDLLVTPAITIHEQAPSNKYQDSNSDVWKGVPKWIRELSLCIRKHESLNMGHYEAENPTSTASGAYQMIYSFWNGNAKWVRIAKRYADGPAGNAPARVQDAVFIHSILNGGVLAWKGTGCGYGT